MSLDELFPRDLTDRGFVHKARLRADRVDLGRRHDTRLFQHDAVALHMPEAFILSDEVGTEMLQRIPARDRAADDIRTAALAAQGHFEIGDRPLFMVGQDLFLDEQRCFLADGRIRLAVGIGDAAQLRGFEDKAGFFFQIYFRRRIEHLFPRAAAVRVMPLNIPHFCVFPHIKGMDAVMFGRIAGIVVDAAARNDRNVGTVADVKIVVDRILKIPDRQQYGDMHRFILYTGADDDVDAVLVRFGNDLNVFIAVARKQLPVFTDVETSLGNIVQVGNGRQKFLIGIVPLLYLLDAHRAQSGTFGKFCEHLFPLARADDPVVFKENDLICRFQNSVLMADDDNGLIMQTVENADEILKAPQIDPRFRFVQQKTPRRP